MKNFMDGSTKGSQQSSQGGQRHPPTGHYHDMLSQLQKHQYQISGRRRPGRNLSILLIGMLLSNPANAQNSATPPVKEPDLSKGLGLNSTVSTWSNGLQAPMLPVSTSAGPMTTGGTPGKAPESQELPQEILNLYSQLEQAYTNGDTSLFSDITSNRFTITAANGKSVGQAEQIAQIRAEQATIKYTSLKYIPLEWQMFKGPQPLDASMPLKEADTIMVRLTVRSSTNNRGQETRINGHQEDEWTLENGKWKLLYSSLLHSEVAPSNSGGLTYRKDARLNLDKTESAELMRQLEQISSGLSSESLSNLIERDVILIGTPTSGGRTSAQTVLQILKAANTSKSPLRLIALDIGYVDGMMLNAQLHGQGGYDVSGLSQPLQSQELKEMLEWIRESNSKGNNIQVSGTRPGDPLQALSLLSRAPGETGQIAQRMLQVPRNIWITATRGPIIRDGSPGPQYQTTEQNERATEEEALKKLREQGDELVRQTDLLIQKEEGIWPETYRRLTLQVQEITSRPWQGYNQTTNTLMISNLDEARMRSNALPGKGRTIVITSNDQASRLRASEKGNPSMGELLSRGKRRIGGSISSLAIIAPGGKVRDYNNGDRVVELPAVSPIFRSMPDGTARIYNLSRILPITLLSHWSSTAVSVQRGSLAPPSLIEITPSNAYDAVIMTTTEEPSTPLERRP